MTLEDFVNVTKIDNDIFDLQPIETQNVIVRENPIDLNTNEDILGNPFAAYQKKPIIKQAVATKYNISSVPGYLYKKNQDQSFSRVSERIVKGNEYPAIETIEKVYYNDKVTNQKSINLAIAILGINITKSDKVELLIKDEITTLLPEEMIDYKILGALKEKLSNNPDYANFYYATGATLSSITYKKYSEQRFKKNLNLSWLTSDGDVFGAKDNFQYKNEIALELVRLMDLVILNE